MRVNFGPRKTIQIDDARLIYCNFRGEKDDFNPNGNRQFSVIIPNEDIADQLKNDINEYGVGWTVKISRKDSDNPILHLPVKVKYTERSQPDVYLDVNGKVTKLDEEDISILDDIAIDHVDIDIRPYDDDGRFGPFRSAYLERIWVYQLVDRFRQRYAEQESPEE